LKKFARRSASTPKFAFTIGEVTCATSETGTNKHKTAGKNFFIGTV